MMLICDDGTDEFGPDEITVMPDFVIWHAALERRGITHQGIRLRPAAEAKTVSVRDGRVLVSDGPYAETKEQIGGFELVECADLDEAIEVAASHPSARRYAVEIRPYWEGEGLTD
ncbi:YciI family protein [Dactylosporangium fulvum]|uniref:YciI family protein n=1 Tax=Dactylosporangium fulvum TaxID=53359 RepID=A0ABY5W3P9_9ACTN|nr:YciI family protein [Dactylosporangium fulvum]UWP84698.1 YciI family protein [Dactylosporangium fulvum]